MGEIAVFFRTSTKPEKMGMEQFIEFKPVVEHLVAIGFLEPSSLLFFESPT